MALTDDGSSANRVIGGSPFVYVTAGGNWLKGDPIGNTGSAFARADDDGGIPCRYIAAADALSGDERCKLFTSAVVKGGRLSGGVAGAPVYLSNTAGRYSNTAGANSRIIGYVVSGDEISVIPLNTPGARTDLSTNLLAPFAIPLSAVLGADGAELAITETAGDFYKTIGTNQLHILGEVSNGTVGADTEVSVGWFRAVLPPEYVDGGGLQIRAGVKVKGTGALGTCTIDFSAYLQSQTAGTVGSDLVTTSATAISGTGGNKDFVVDPTGLVAGDALIVKMTTSVDNTDSTAIQAQIHGLFLLCDIKG